MKVTLISGKISRRIPVYLSTQWFKQKKRHQSLRDMMLLRDNTLQYLYIFLASSIIKIELKKCVVHEIGRMRLHLRPQETQPKWVVCLMSYHRERTGGKIIFLRGGEGTDWAMFLGKNFFHHQVEQEFILIVPYVSFAWLAWHDCAGCFLIWNPLELLHYLHHVLKKLY